MRCPCLAMRPSVSRPRRRWKQSRRPRPPAHPSGRFSRPEGHVPRSLTAQRDPTHGGKSRGSALYTGPEGLQPLPELPEGSTFTLEEDGTAQIQEAAWKDGACRFTWRAPMRCIGWAKKTLPPSQWPSSIFRA